MFSRVANSLINGCPEPDCPRSVLLALPRRLVGNNESSKRMTRKTLIALIAGFLALGATACNTVRGAGQDLQSVANDVDEAI